MGKQNTKSINNNDLIAEALEGNSISSKPQVFDVKKMNRSGFITTLLAFLIPALLMCIISANALKGYYQQFLESKDSVSSNDKVLDFIGDDVQNAQESEKKKSFSYALNKYIYTSSSFNIGILKGIFNDVEDAYKTSKFSLTADYNIVNHFDLSYLILTKLCAKENIGTFGEGSVVQTIMESNAFKFALAMYWIRFGLASLTMFLFATYCLKLDEKKSLIASITYSLSSIVILFAQNSSIMNIVIIIPLLMWAIVRYSKLTNVSSALILSTVSGLLFLTGIYGVIFGLPFILIFTIFIGIVFEKPLKTNILSFLLSIPSISFGLLLSWPAWLTWMSDSEITNSLPDSLVASQMRYTFLDFLYKFLPLSNLNLTYNSSNTSIPTADLSINKIYNTGTLGTNAFDVNLYNTPSMYMSMLALFLIVLFFINKRISIKTKVASGVLIFAYNLSYSFVPLDTLKNAFNMGTALGSVNFVFLNAIISFIIIMSLGLMNDDIKENRKTLWMILLFVIITFAIYDGDNATSVKVILSAALPLLYYWVLNLNISSKKISAVLLVTLCLELGLVTNINYNNNSLSNNLLKNPMTSVIEENGIDYSGVDDIRLFGENSDISFVAVDYFEMMPQNTFELANLIYSNYYGEQLFKEIDPLTMYTECVVPDDSGFHIESSDYGKIIITYDGRDLDDNSRLFLFSDYPSKSQVHYTNVSFIGLIERATTERGTFIRDITNEVDDLVAIINEYGLQLEIDLMDNDGEKDFHTGLYVADKDAIIKFNQLFTQNKIQNGTSRMLTVILDKEYKSNLKIKVGMRVYDTYDFCGKIAFNVDSMEIEGKTINLSNSSTASVLTIILVSAVWSVLFVLIILTRNKELKEESNK